MKNYRIFFRDQESLKLHYLDTDEKLVKNWLKCMILSSNKFRFEEVQSQVTNDYDAQSEEKIQTYPKPTLGLFGDDVKNEIMQNTLDSIADRFNSLQRYLDNVSKTINELEESVKDLDIQVDMIRGHLVL